jgi:uncharacterized membrane protein
MRWHLASILVGALVIAGCQQKSEPGGPGALAKQEGITNRVDKKETFELSVPRTATTLKPGEQKEISLGIHRGREFKEVVSLKFDVPKDLKVEPMSADIKPDDSKHLKIKVEAAKDATPGKKAVVVIATPKEGAKTSESIQVEVQKPETEPSVPRTPLR